MAPRVTEAEAVVTSVGQGVPGYTAGATGVKSSGALKGAARAAKMGVAAKRMRVAIGSDRPVTTSGARANDGLVAPSHPETGYTAHTLGTNETQHLSPTLILASAAPPRAATA